MTDKDDVARTIGAIVLRTRNLMRMTLVFTLFLTVLSASIVYDSARLRSIDARAQDSITCVTANQARADNRVLWDYVVSTEKPSPALTKFEQHILVATAPRDCQ